MPQTARANRAAAKAKASAAAAGTRALSLCSSLGDSKSEMWLQPQSMDRQRLGQIVPALGDGAAKVGLGSPAGGRVGRHGPKADSDPPTCGECRLCGQPCQRACWIDSCRSAECPPHGALSGRAGVPPKAKAKGVAAQAKAKAAAAGKAKARAKAMGKGGRALPEGALGPPSPCRWVRAVCLPRFRCQQRVRGSQRS